MGIEEYSRKRDFARTPEPKPASAATDGRTFVVHRHEARRLHYDLRIRAGGVLASWAVPKGFSYDPKDKRLAVRTEDHPLEYEEFQGVIPRGEYGAGTMQIWDGGSYSLVKELDIARALEKGELKIQLRGRRLRGEWHLVRTKSGKGNEWLLFKARDRYAGTGSDIFGGADLKAAQSRPFPRRVAFMEPSPGHAPFSHPDWIFEPILEGERVMVSIREGTVSLRGGAGEISGLAAIERDLGSLRTAAALL